MTERCFKPTEEQTTVICHDGSAFVTACPGAGKTRIMTERARRLFQEIPTGRGVAFLSFTNAAVFELEARLRNQRLLPTPSFPHFLGTFDSFVWAFLVSPFGVPGSDKAPRLLRDIGSLMVTPFRGARPLSLSCFCPETGELLEDEAKMEGFDLTKQKSKLPAYRTAAKRLRSRLRQRGQLGFEDARFVATERIGDPLFSKPISTALSRRFVEVIVDEAQDCNPQDLAIIKWLIESGIPVKIVCDPNQSIYGFRGGVTDHLESFRRDFPMEQRMGLGGNFRSTKNICKAITQLRPPSFRENPDDAIGPFRDCNISVRILAYSGTKVPASIGSSFCSLVKELNIDVSSSPIIAATKASAAAAAGQPQPTNSQERTIRLAQAVTGFHFSSGFYDIKASLECVHKIMLELEDKLGENSYDQYIAEKGMEPLAWRSRVVSILRTLRFDTDKYSDARSWHKAAKELLSKELTIKDGQSISQRLRWHGGLDGALSIVQDEAPTPRTIHSVKGKEYPAVCVVTTNSTLRSIIDFLETGNPSERAEDARKLYVAASRAERLLAIAAPSSQAKRLKVHLQGQGSVVEIERI